MSYSGKPALKLPKNNAVRPEAIPVGLVGLGLMGTSIATCLLAAGHPVTGVERDPAKRSKARRQVVNCLKEMRAEGLLKADVRRLADRLDVTKEYAALADARIVIESIIEDVKVKRACLRDIERSVSPETIIGTNTSAIPPSQ